MKLGDSDYAVFDNAHIGSDHSAVINRGILSATLEQRQGFKDVAIKAFRGNVSNFSFPLP